MEYSSLKAGQKVCDGRYTLTSRDIAEYVSAVSDSSPMYSDGSTAPPTAVAALALKSVLEALAIPAGTIHVGQELEFKEHVRAGQDLSCEATLVQNSVRGNSRFLSIAIEVRNEEGASVLQGKSTIVVPA